MYMYTLAGVATLIPIEQKKQPSNDLTIEYS